MSGNRRFELIWFRAELAVFTLLLGRAVASAQNCPPPPTQYPLGELEGPVVSNVTTGSRNGSVAVDGQAKFLVAYETNPDVQGRNTVRGSAFATITPLPWQCLWTASLSACEVPGCRHLSPSAAVHLSDAASVAWISSPLPATTGSDRLTLNLFQLGAPPLSPAFAADGLPGNAQPSQSTNSTAFTQAYPTQTGPVGLLYAHPPGNSQQIRACSPYCYSSWQPCVSARSDGGFVIAWADAEDPTFEFPTLNIKMQQYFPDGNAAGVGSDRERPWNGAAPEPPGVARYSGG